MPALGESSSSPAPSPAEWTVVTRLTRKSHRARASQHGSSTTVPAESRGRLHSNQDERILRCPPPPDADATLPLLRAHYQRSLARWRADATSGTGVAGEWQAVVERIPAAEGPWRLDTVVLVALGRLSNSYAWFDAAAAEAEAEAEADASTPAGPASSITTIRNIRSGSGKTKKGAARVAISGGSPRETSMRQLAAVESWIETLQAKGHFAALPKAEQTPSNRETDQEDGARESPTDLPPPSYVTPAQPLVGGKIVQEPLINALDAAFLTELGWTVLPSTRAACRPRDATAPVRAPAATPSAASEPAATTSSPSETASSNALPNRQALHHDPVRLNNAAAHVSRSTLLFAPHAPHGLVRWLLGARRGGEDGGRDGVAATKADDAVPERTPPPSISQSAQRANLDQTRPASRPRDTDLAVDLGAPGVYIGNDVSRVIEWQPDREKDEANDYAQQGDDAPGSAAENARLQAWLDARTADTTAAVRRGVAFDGVLGETWAYTYSTGTGRGAPRSVGDPGTEPADDAVTVREAGR